MPSPFPGMDPYLENPAIWPDVHHGLIATIRRLINPRLRPKYVARVEQRVYISDEDDPGREVIVPDVRIETRRRPRASLEKHTAGLAIAEPLIIPFFIDDEIEEARLEIIEVKTGKVVTVMEILSPSNKIRGSRGRTSFMTKRQEIMASEVHWVEIDLLRSGAPSVTRPPLVPSDYRILVSRAGERNKARYWPVSVRQELPVVGIPVRVPDDDVPLDLGVIFRTAYDDAEYDATIDYRRPPVPPLRGDDAKWAARLLRGKI